MRDHEKSELKEIWGESFKMACFIYSLTDRESYSIMMDLRKNTRSVTVEILGLIMEGLESTGSHSRENCFRAAAVRLAPLKNLMLRGYQDNCISYQDLTRFRDYCTGLRDRLLDPGLEALGNGSGFRAVGGSGTTDV